jgi:hypothetical protein
MESILVIDEFVYNGCDEGTIVTPCANEDVAKKIIKQRWEQYLKEVFYPQWVDENGVLDEGELDEGDVWSVADDGITISIQAKELYLSLCIEHKLVEE